MRLCSQASMPLEAQQNSGDSGSQLINKSFPMVEGSAGQPKKKVEHVWFLQVLSDTDNLSPVSGTPHRVKTVAREKAPLALKKQRSRN